MKPTQLFSVLIFTGSLLFQTGLALAQSDVEKSPRPYLGVKLDPNPLPELLVKHLNLDPNMGLLIKNIQQDSPADKAGLEKDDIILRFADTEVTGYRQLVDLIRGSGVGKEVELEILHNGQRQKKSLILEAYQETIDWKYPFEKPTFSQPFRPGRMFRLDPDNERWQQIPFPNMSHLPDFNFQPPGQYHGVWPPQWNPTSNDFDERLERLEKRQDEMLKRLDEMLKAKDSSK